MNFQEGDIYRWTYKDIGSNTSTTAYWCKSQIAYFKDSKLFDTYWSDRSIWFPLETVEKVLNLEYIENFNNLEELKDNKEYYKEEDIIDLSHPNSYGKLLYKKKGAGRNRQVMIELAKYALDEWKRKKESAVYNIIRAQSELNNLLSGESLNQSYIYLP